MVLCNCRIEAENNFILESLAACHNVECGLVMYFMVITAFINYLESLGNLTDSLKLPILLNRNSYEQTLPISFQAFQLESELLQAPKMPKDFVY